MGNNRHCCACGKPTAKGAYFCLACRVLPTSTPGLRAAVRKQAIRWQAERLARIRKYIADADAERARRGGQW